MNYTSNHHLPQWVSSDRVKMEDFNSAMSSIESGLNSAQSSASAANSAANSALTKAEAAYSPDNMPYVVGSYTGNGLTSLAIELGFMPSFLIISGMQTSFDANDLSSFDRYYAIVGSTGSIVGQQLQNRLQLLPNGFSVYKVGNISSQLPILNELNRKYYYIAFR